MSIVRRIATHNIVGPLIFASLLALCASVSETSAHARLLSAAPAKEATLAIAPVEIVLSFDKAIVLDESEIVVMGKDGRLLEVGAPVFASDDARTIVIHLDERTRPGHYTVEWRIRSTDGHKNWGRYGLNVEE